MLRPAVNQIAKNNESPYSLVIAVAKRARGIADELVEKKEILEEKPVKTAVNDFYEGKFKMMESSKLHNK